MDVVESGNKNIEIQVVTFEGVEIVSDAKVEEIVN